MACAFAKEFDAAGLKHSLLRSCGNESGCASHQMKLEARPASFAAYVKTEVERWAVIVKNSGATLE